MVFTRTYSNTNNWCLHRNWMIFFFDWKIHLYLVVCCSGVQNCIILIYGSVQAHGLVNLKDLLCHFQTLSHEYSDRHEAFAVSRNIGEPGAEKKIPVLPENAVKNILEEPFKSSERTSKEASWTVTNSFLDIYIYSTYSKCGYICASCLWKFFLCTDMHVLCCSMQQRGVSDIPAKKYFYGSEEDLHHSTGRRTRAQAICIKMSRFGCQLCFYRKTRDATFMKNTYLYKFIGVHNGQLVMKPGTV